MSQSVASQVHIQKADLGQGLSLHACREWVLSETNKRLGHGGEERLHDGAEEDITVGRHLL